MKPFWLREKQVFIMPTGSGLLFLALILILILAAASSGNNLVFGLGFTLFSVFFLAMISTHNNLKNTNFELLSVDDAFVDERVTLRFSLTNQGRRSSLAVTIDLLDRDLQTLKAEVGEVTGEGPSLGSLSFKALRRGEHQCPMVKAQTVYPLGLFRAWVYYQPRAQFYVYPKRQGALRINPMDLGRGQGETRGLSSESQHADFREHARYQAGQPYHHIDWKAFARTRRLLTRQYETSVPEVYTIDWRNLTSLGFEERLSQMAKWVDMLSRSGSVFSLKLPSRNLAAGSGFQHRQACLRELAMVPEEV